MNTNAASGATGQRRTHPAIIVAAVAVTGLCVVGVAALLGWLPGAASVNTPASTAMPAQQVSGGVASEYPVPAEPAAETAKPAPAVTPAPAAKPAPTPKPAPAATAGPKSPPKPGTPSYADAPARTATASPVPDSIPVPAPVTKVCANCGTVTAVSPIEQPGEGSGLGAVIGGVVGGVLGHQVGGGRGKDVATVAGAVGGAYAGHQIEKGQKKSVTWEVRVKFEDGSSRAVKFTSEPKYRVGDKVRLEGGRLVRG